jgi:hypothetical protein
MADNEHSASSNFAPDFDPPDYALPANREEFFALCRDLAVFDQDKTIFENLVDFIQKHKLNPTIRYSEFTDFLQKKALPGLTLDVNIDTHAKKVIHFLTTRNLCKVLEGTDESPVRFVLTDRHIDLSEITDSEPLAHIEEVKQLVYAVYENIDITQKLDIPFPTILNITETARTHPELRGVNLSRIWKDGVLSIKVDDFNSAFIEKSKVSDKIIRIDFDEENHILLTPETEQGLFQSVLTKKTFQYVQDNPDIQDRIRVVLKKNQKEIPDISAIFHDISTENSFFWILSFKRIMEYLYQHKKNNITYLHYYEAASLLYQYSLNRREAQQKDEIEKQKENTFKDELLRAMIFDFAEPWTYERIVSWHSQLPQPLIQDSLTREFIDKFIKSANETPLQTEGIPLVLVFNLKEETCFVHKYRFAQFFLTQRDRESQRLKNIYVEHWSRSPQNFGTDEAFDMDIREHLSDLFHHLLFRTVPMIFGFPNTAQRLFPDMVVIKNQRLQDADLSDMAKHKIIYQALTSTLFSEKNAADLKPLHILLDLNQRLLHKLAREYALRSVPFWRRGLLGFLFRWLFDLIENFSIKEEVRAAVAAARTIEDLDAILEKHKSSRSFPVVRQIVDRRRHELLQAQNQAAQKEKNEQRQGELDSKQKRAEKIAELKKHYLKGQSLEDRMAALSKEWNPKIGKARSDTENNVVNAVMVMMNRVKRFKLTVEEIETLSERVTTDPAFAEIKNRAAFKSYISLLIFNRLIRRVD